jgi:non-specific serine/threonine protein kinase
VTVSLLSYAAGNLPVQLTSFVGRRKEMADARRILADVRLLTLSGVGGVGKTRLAIRIAADLRQAFPDGVWLVELGELEDPGMLAEHVAGVFGLDADPEGSTVDTLLRVIADKKLLLLLDGCEHVVDECAVLVGKILSNTEKARVLTTSRQPLGITGEHTYGVPTMEVPALVTTARPSVLEQYDSIGLFAVRAAAIQPDFTITEDNAHQVIRLCQQLDGIPLAIELAAARLRAFSLGQIIDRLGDRFRLLTAGNRIALPRQRTLRALIDWSFGLCSAEERTMWANLSVFVGGFDLDAVEAVCAAEFSAEELFDLVGALVEKSIVIRADTGGRVRYQMLETIRQYGRDRLAERGTQYELRARHRDWCLWLVERAQAEWWGPDHELWRRRVQEDGANLRVAIDFCLADPREGRRAIRLVTGLCDHRLIGNSLGDARRWLDHALSLVTAPSADRARALWMAAWFALIQGNRDTATPLLRQCRELAELLDDEALRARVVQFTGLVRLYAGDLDAAVHSLEEALRRHRALHDRDGMQLTFAQLTMAQSFAGHPNADANIQRCLALSDPVRRPRNYAFALWYRAVERWRVGDLPGASASARQALAPPSIRQDRWFVALCLEVLGWATTDPVSAARLLGAADASFRAVGTMLAGLRHVADPHERRLRELRSALGEDAVAAAYQQGSELNTDDVLAFGTEESVSTPPTPVPGRGPLTRRERQIAELVASGLSNKEIAATLVIAPRTVETHVEHIFAKLGFTRRTQIAAWMNAAANAASASP